jgi:hypothetical protein
LPDFKSLIRSINKKLYDLYGIATVRYSSSGFTRSVLRYLGAAKDLESNIFATRAEAIRAIQEIESRGGTEIAASAWTALNPARSALGKLLAVWIVALVALIAIHSLSPCSTTRFNTPRRTGWFASRFPYLTAP